jgi:diacylglycerol kinase (ATP)
LGRTVVGDPGKSPFVRIASGRSFEVRLEKKLPYEMDGGERKSTKRLRVSVDPRAITVCVASEDS